MYRILTRVDKGGPVGSLCRFEWLAEEQIGQLLVVGAIAPVTAPPLDVLPGWSRRAAMLAPLGIVNADQLLEADPETVCQPLKVKPETVKRWQEEVTRQLTAPQQRER